MRWFLKPEEPKVKAQTSTPIVSDIPITKKYLDDATSHEQVVELRPRGEPTKPLDSIPLLSNTQRASIGIRLGGNERKAIRKAIQMYLPSRQMTCRE